MQQLTISQDGFDLIKKWEGFRLVAYQDGGGVWTVGYGSTYLPSGRPVQRGDRLTKTEALRAMRVTAQKYMDRASHSIKVRLTQNQVDAIASLIYNIGVHAFVNSTLCRKINQRKWVAASKQFVRKRITGGWAGWVFDNGVEIPGLVNRRLEERSLFISQTPESVTQNYYEETPTTFWDDGFLEDMDDRIEFKSRLGRWRG